MDEREPIPTETTVRGADAARPPLFHPLTVCVLAGLGAGLLAFGLGELSYDAYLPKKVPTNLMGSIARLPSAETQQVAVTKNAVLAYAELGAMLGLYLGVAGGLARRSAVGAGLGGALGLVLGGAVGAALPYPTFYVFFRADRLNTIDPIVVGLVLHDVVWGLIGGVAGVAFGYGLGGPRRMFAYFMLGFVGAAIGAGIYEAVGGVFYPLAKTDQPLAAAWQPRLLARMLVCLGAGVMIGLSFPKKKRREAV
jgi:hypothetical protein